MSTKEEETSDSGDENDMDEGQNDVDPNLQGEIDENGNLQVQN